MEELVRQLTSVYGPSGRETAVADLIEKLLKGKVDSFRRDALGNLICEKKGTAKDGKRIMLSAHMDQIGLVVTHAEKEGFLRVSNVGGLSPNNLRMRHVRFHNGVEGVLVEQPLKAGQTSSLTTFFIDIGAKNAEEALKMVQVGDMAVFAEPCFAIGKQRLAAPAMDDRSACALLVSILQTLPASPNTVVAVFSTQEEVGLRGSRAAAYSVSPDEGIALDVTLCGDLPEDRKLVVNLGDGPAIKIMDHASISNPQLVERLFAAAKRAKVACQREVLPYGGTDAASIQLTKGGIPVCTVSIPCRNVHSACEIVDLQDIEGARKVMVEYLAK
ncbi:MAG: M20/M25/M40 family metallo-hydrolase [Eubacteriales bacterium]|nr:M20/M25/M40 family metallo-hydrolase [Eubacteriales bacterium]